MSSPSSSPPLKRPRHRSRSPPLTIRTFSLRTGNEISNKQLACECLDSNSHELSCLLKKPDQRLAEVNDNSILREPREESLWNEQLNFSAAEEREECVSSCWALREKKVWTVGGLSLGFLVSICLILITYGIWSPAPQFQPDKSSARAVIFTPMIRTLNNNFKRPKVTAVREHDYYSPSLVNTVIQNLTKEYNDSSLLGDRPKMFPRDSLDFDMTIKQGRNDKILIDHLLKAIHNNIQRMKENTAPGNITISTSDEKL